jgi:hypothetical protein
MAFKELRKFSDIKMEDGSTILKRTQIRQQMGGGPFQATARIFVPWTEVEQTKAKLLGGQRTDGDIELPVYYDIRKPTGTFAGKGYPFAVATTCSSEMVGGFTDLETSSTMDTPEHANIDVQFINPGWTIDLSGAEPKLPTALGTMKWCMTESLEQSSEFLSLPDSKKEQYYWGIGDDLVSDESDIPPFNINVMFGTWMVTRYYMTKQELEMEGAYGPKYIQDYIGTVNTRAYKSIKYGVTFHPESLLFECPVVEDFDTPMGTVYTVTFVMRWKKCETVKAGIPNGWNTFIRPGKADEGIGGVQYSPISTKKPIGGIEDPATVNIFYRPYEKRDWGTLLPEPVVA